MHAAERSTAAWAVPGRSPTSSAKRPRPVSSAASSTRSTARPTRRGKVLGESGGLGMRSAVQGTIGEMVAGNGSGDSPGNDGSSLVRAPTRTAYSFADTDRAVIFPIRRTGRLRSEVIAPVLGHLAAQSVLGSTITLVVPTCHVPPSIIPCVERTG